MTLHKRNVSPGEPTLHQHDQLLITFSAHKPLLFIPWHFILHGFDPGEYFEMSVIVFADTKDAYDK